MTTINSEWLRANQQKILNIILVLFVLYMVRKCSETDVNLQIAKKDLKQTEEKAKENINNFKNRIYLSIKICVHQ